MGRQKVEKRKNTSPRRCHEHSKSNILGQADDFFRCSGEKLNIFGLLCSNVCRGTGAKMHHTIVSYVFIHVYMHKYMYIQYFFIYTSPCTHTQKIYIYLTCVVNIVISGISRGCLHGILQSKILNSTNAGICPL